MLYYIFLLLELQFLICEMVSITKFKAKSQLKLERFASYWSAQCIKFEKIFIFYACLCNIQYSFVVDV